MEDNFDIEKIMNVVKTIQAVSSPIEDVNTENEIKKVINDDFEHKNTTPAINSIKAAIPYLDTKYQKNLGVMIKIIEIERLLNNFQAMSIGGENNKERKIKMLQAVKTELDLKKQKVLDIFIRVMEIKDILEDMQNE